VRVNEARQAQHILVDEIAKIIGESTHRKTHPSGAARRPGRMTGLEILCHLYRRASRRFY